MKNKKEKKGKPAKKAPTPAVKPVVKELSDQELESVTGGVITAPRDIASGQV
jgi:bacteriocin-like protein